MEIPLFYKRHFLVIELFLAVFATFIIFIIFSRVFTEDQIHCLILIADKQIYSIIALGAITLLGFIITGVSILITFTETEKLKLLKGSKQYKTLFDIYFSTIKFLAITTILSVMGILIQDPTKSKILFYLILLGVLISAIRIWRCVWVLEQIIGIVHE
jgi:hypothetical protein